jgi:HemY protein
MKAAIWLLTLFSTAVALSIGADHPLGIVSIFISGYKIDVSINFAVLVLITSFLVLYFAIRAVSSLLALPRIAKRWRLQQRERSMHESLLSALEQLMTGRFLRSLRSAAQTVEHANSLEQLTQVTESAPKYLNQLRALAHLIGAESAHALRDISARERHLQAILKDTSLDAESTYETREATLLSAARWSLAEADPITALSWIRELKGGVSRRTLTLRLKLKADRLAKHHLAALETARLLNKHGAFSENAAKGLLRSLCTASLDDCYDQHQLQQTWKLLDAHEKSLPEIAIHASERMLALSGNSQIALNWLTPVWNIMVNKPNALSDSQQVRLVQTLSAHLKEIGADKQWLANIDQARAMNPRSPLLQYLSATACVHNGLWGKAQQLMLEASQQLTHSELKKSAWRTLAELAQQRGQEAEAIEYWKKIATN